MGAPMKGLVQFIADLRNAKVKEAEEKRIKLELANIQKHFAAKSITGYQTKKYVAKLLYIYILGYPVDFGAVEAIGLLSSPVYSEKQIGYLGVSLLLNETNDLLHLALNSISKDLNADNEEFNILALHCIATVGGPSMADMFLERVYNLLKSPISPPQIRKKAALALLCLFRSAPGAFPSDWIRRIVPLIDDPNLGVATSAASLILGLVAQSNTPQLFSACYPLAVKSLCRIILDHQYPKEYEYYSVPCPWLQVKLFQLLQYLDRPRDETLSSSLLQLVVKSLSANARPAVNDQQAHAQNSILFEVISLAIKLDINLATMDKIVAALGQFLTSTQTNGRYLALDALCHVATQFERNLHAVREFLPAVVALLKDRDVSVRRKALELLYCICDASNLEQITGELLKYLEAADYALREDLVIKIAVLAEKYATDVQWYVHTILKLVSLGGNHITDQVWERVLQIVVNNESVQSYFAKITLQQLKGSSNKPVHEIVIRMGAFVLGEFGNLIADAPGAGATEQHKALAEHYPFVSVATKVMILSAFAKFAVLYPELRQPIAEFFAAQTASYDCEIQQRAFEYGSLLKTAANHPDLLPAVLDEMPPFPARVSPLLAKLEASRLQRDRSVRRPAAGGQLSYSDLLQSHGSTGSSASLPFSAPDGPPASSASSAPPLTASWEQGFYRLAHFVSGVFFENSLVKLLVRSDYSGESGLVTVDLLNKSPAPLHSVYAEVSVPLLESPGSEEKFLPLQISTERSLDADVPLRGKTSLTVRATVFRPYSEPPKLHISFTAGTLTSIDLKLPILLHKFLKPTVLAPDEFFRRWKQIGAEDNRQFQKVFRSRTRLNAQINERMVTLMNWGVCPNVDKSPNAVVGAALLKTVKGGSFGCLMRLEPNDSFTMYRVTVRATDGSVATILGSFIAELYEMGP